MNFEEFSNDDLWLSCPVCDDMEVMLTSCRQGAHLEKIRHLKTVAVQSSKSTFPLSIPLLFVYKAHSQVAQGVCAA